MAYRNIYSAVIFFVALFFAGEIGAQTTVQANRVIAKDSIRIGSRWVYLVDIDATFTTVSDRAVPTTKAVRDFVRASKNKVWQIDALSDTTGISGELEGDVAYVSSGDTLAFRDSLHWLVFAGGGGGGGASEWTMAADTGTPAVISDGETVTYSGGYGINTVISGNTITSTADTTQIATQSDISGLTPITASNGLTKTGNDIKLGGTLTGATTITGASQDFTETGLKYYEFEADSAIWRINGQKFLHMGSIKGSGYNYDEVALGYRAGANLPAYNSTANTLVGSYAGENLNGTGTGAGAGVSNALFGYTTGRLLTTGSYNSFFGVAAAAGTAVTTSFSGGFGHHALIYATGNYNYGFGNNTLSLVTGGGNVAMGQDAISKATSAEVNTGVGHLVMEELTTGDYNTGIGGGTMRNITTGSQNSVFGSGGFGALSTGSGNIGLGYNAGGSETGSNKLYIDNSNTTSPLIGGDLSNNYVGINQAVSSLAYTLDINSTGAMRFPRGTTAQRPSTAAGIFRVNSDSTRFEWYTGSAWKSFAHVGDVTGGFFGVTSVGLSLPSIFSVSGSPVTTSGTLTATLATQTANTIFAGPTTGSAAAPTFRAMAEADLPAYDVGRILFSDPSTGKPTESANLLWDNTNGAVTMYGTGGTSAPVLQVRNNVGNIAWINVTDNSTGAGGTNGLLFGYNGAAYLYNRENTPMYLATNDLVRLTLANGTGVGSGFVSIGMGTNTGTRLLHVQQPTAITNTTNYSLRVGHVTSATAAAGFGVGTEYEVEDGSGNIIVGASEENVVTTATAGSVSADLVWKTRRGGTLSESLRSLGNGTLQIATLSGTVTQLGGYTAGNIASTWTTSYGLTFSGGVMRADTSSANGLVTQSDLSSAVASAGDGNGIIDALPSGNVTISTSHILTIDDGIGDNEIRLNPSSVELIDASTNTLTIQPTDIQGNLMNMVFDDLVVTTTAGDIDFDAGLDNFNVQGDTAHISAQTRIAGNVGITDITNGDGVTLAAYAAGNILTSVTIDATGNIGLLFDDGSLTLANNISEVADTVTRTLGTGQQIYANGYAGYSGTGFSYSSGRITNGSGAARICKIRYYFTAETAGTLTDALTVKVMIWDGATYTEHRAGRLTLTLVDNVAIVGAKETVITLPDGDGVNIAFDSTDGLDVSNFGYVIEKI